MTTRHERHYQREDHPDIRPELHALYSSAVRYAVRWVQNHVTGAEAGIDPEELRQEARLLVWRHHASWERRARNLAALARVELRGLLANEARAILRDDRAYGDYNRGRWGYRAPVLDPASRGSYAWDDDSGLPVPVGVAESPEDMLLRYVADPDDPYDSGRGFRWARTFRRRYPDAAEAFLALGDRVRDPSVSQARFNARMSRDRLRLRERYAHEIAAVDAAEAEHDDRRLLSAMFWEAA